MHRKKKKKSLIVAYFSAYDALYAELRILEQRNIFSSTGCYKPCTYREYRLIGDSQTSSSGAADFLFSLWAVSNDTTVEREVLIYPWTAMVADMGGTLGLFLGFSFMTIWDGAETLVTALHALKCGACTRQGKL